MVDEIIFNGVDIDTGDYATPPVSLEELAAAIAVEGGPDSQLKADLEFRKKNKEDSFAVKAGVTADKLSEAGWGVIFPANFDPEILKALAPLLKHRREEAGPRYRQFTESTGRSRWYQGPSDKDPGEDKRSFLKARGAADSGAADPDRMPYYLLLVGDPEEIPYSFQYQLDVQYAVGRIHFDSIDGYTQYARNVVEAETGPLALERKLSFFAPANDGDAATILSASQLAEPLSKIMGGIEGWSVDTCFRNDATKDRLRRLMGGSATPALLFTASHGASKKPFNDPDVFRLTGALLCQEWVPKKKPAPAEAYFCGDDIKPGANLFGTIGMHFACFGGGSPQFDNFPKIIPAPATQIAPRAFVSNLPKQMLINGALATIAHVDRAFGHSFLSEDVPQIQDFESTLRILMEGKPVGLAMEAFNARYAELSSDLAQAKEAREVREAIGSIESPNSNLYLIGHWTATNDARNYLVIGDPAVRLRLAQPSKTPQRPELRLTSVAAPAPKVDPPLAPLPAGDSVSFGFSDTVSDIAATLNQTLEKLATSLQSVIADIATVEVRTYTSDRMAEVRYQNGAITGAQLRAYSAVSLAGQATNCVPEKDGVVDAALWQIHSDAVTKALQSRTELLKTAIGAIASLAQFAKR